MQQRRPRLGDILDDYCPRERRITNHVVVAMVEDTVKQTRCTTCDSDHEYKEARVPLSRRKKPADVIPSDAALRTVPAVRASTDPPMDDAAAPPLSPEPPDVLDTAAEPEDEPRETGADEEDWPVHRPLIRATLPRPEGQSPERKAPDFTLRQSGGRFEQSRNGARQRSRPRHGQGGQGGSGGQHARSGPRPGGPGPSGERQGNRSGNAAGNRGGRPQGHGQGRGNRQGQPGGGHGRKRGR